VGPRARWTLAAAAVVAIVYVPFWLSAAGAWPGGAAHFDNVIPSMEPRFADLGVVVRAFDCHQPGVDLQRMNVCDPWQRAMNYPRLWLRFGALGLRADDLVATGIAVGAAALAALLWWMAPASAAQAGLVALALASPPLLLGVERANIDLLILLLMLAAARLLGSALLERTLGHVLIYGAFALKLFPLAALARALVEPPALRRWLVPALAVAVPAYLWAIRHQLATIVASTPHDTYWSFGGSVLPYSLAAYGAWPETWARPLGLATTLVLIAIGAAMGWRHGRRWPPQAAAPAAGLDLGALLFLGVFVLGSSYAYRLVFLLLCWPAWIALALGEDAPLRRLACMALALTLTGFWLVPLGLDALPLLALVPVCAALLAARCRFAAGRFD
jgi:hypothetical protein